MNIFYTAQVRWFSNEITIILSRRAQMKKLHLAVRNSKYWFLSSNHRPIEKFDLVVQVVSLLGPGPVNANLHTFYKLLPGPSYTGERTRGLEDPQLRN